MRACIKLEPSLKTFARTLACLLPEIRSFQWRNVWNLYKHRILLECKEVGSATSVIANSCYINTMRTSLANSKRRTPLSNKKRLYSLRDSSFSNHRSRRCSLWRRCSKPRARNWKRLTRTKSRTTRRLRRSMKNSSLKPKPSESASSNVNIRLWSNKCRNASSRKKSKCCKYLYIFINVTYFTRR